MEDFVEIRLEVVLVADVPEEDGLVEAGPAEGALYRRPRPHPLLRDGRHGDDDGRGRVRSRVGGTGTGIVASDIPSEVFCQRDEVNLDEVVGELSVAVWQVRPENTL